MKDLLLLLFDSADAAGFLKYPLKRSNAKLVDEVGRSRWMHHEAAEAAAAAAAAAGDPDFLSLSLSLSFPAVALGSVGGGKVRTALCVKAGTVSGLLRGSERSQTTTG